MDVKEEVYTLVEESYGSKLQGYSKGDQVELYDKLFIPTSLSNFEQINKLIL